MCPYIIVLWSYKTLLGSGQPFLQTRAITVFNWCPNWWTLVAHLTKSSMRGSVNSQKRLYYFSDPSRAIFFLFYILKTKKRIFSDAAATGVNWWTLVDMPTSWINPLQLCFFHIWTQRKIFCDKTMIKRRSFITNWLQEHDQISPKYDISVLICFGQKRSTLARKSALRRRWSGPIHFFFKI